MKEFPCFVRPIVELDVAKANCSELYNLHEAGTDRQYPREMAVHTKKVPTSEGLSNIICMLYVVVYSVIC